jgi:iron complex outermembrane receptor protein
MSKVSRITQSNLLGGAALALLIAASGATVASAQSAEGLAQDEAGEPTQVQDIVVTGTSIRGVAPVGSSLVELGRGDIEASTSGNTAQIIREIPQVLNFGVSESNRTSAGGAGNKSYSNSINIRGIGPYATLALMNGRRVVNQGTIASNFDPSIIPTVALQRIEVIADGASAIYGSDAVSGVANVILRRSYDGIGLDARYGVGADYHDYTVGLITGKSWDSGRFTVAAQEAFRSNLSGEDRDFYRADLRTSGGGDYRTRNCSPGTIQVGGVNYALGAGPLVAGTTNFCDTTKTSDLLPEQRIRSATLTFDQDLTSNIRFFADGLVSERVAMRRSAVANQSLTVPETNAYFTAPAGIALPTCAASVGVAAGTRCLNVLYSFANDYQTPYATTDVDSKTWQLTGGFEFTLPRDWRAKVFATRGYNNDVVLTAGETLRASALNAALRSSNPATAFNPFGGGNSASLMRELFDDYTETDGTNEIWDIGVNIDGDLLQLPGGALKMAAGAEYYDLNLETGQRRGPAGAMTGTPQVLTRDVKSVYGELLIPIFGPENAIPGFNSLDVNLAVRHDIYSDVGSTTNPKIGVNWTPAEGLRVNASYGTSFRAPLMSPELVSALGFDLLFVQNYYDPQANGGAGGTIRGVAVGGTNYNLEPETAETWSFGVDYAPPALRGVRFNANYFALTYEGQIASYFTNTNVLAQESLYSSIISRGADAQSRIAQLVNGGMFILGGSAAEALASPVLIDGYYKNLGTTEASGVDFGISAPWSSDTLGDFRATLRGTHFMSFKVAQTPGAALREQKNNIEYPQNWRLRGSLEWSRGPWEVTGFVNYQNAYDNTFAAPVEKVDANTTVDLSIGYDLQGLTGQSIRIGVDATNLFDKEPPFVDLAPSTIGGGGGFDASSASPLGRVVSVSLRASF